MQSCNQVSTFVYDTKDFNFSVKSHEETESPFDDILQRKWKQAEEAKIFRYILNIRNSKTLKGKYKFLAQFNPERAQCRRTPQSITSMLQLFNSTCFNFTKLKQSEILLDIGNGDGNDIVAINTSPLENCHSLLITERLKCLPQIMTEYSLRKAVELCFLSNSCFFRVAFNSLCAHASVNHLHWHLYYLRHEMLLEYIDVCSYAYGVHLLIDYPAKGLCIKLSSFKNIRDFVSRTFLVVNYLQLHQIAHNVYITRAKLKLNDELYDDVRIYIWARKSCVGVKDTIAFLPAVCELFGHLSIKDENVYDNLKEDDVIDLLNDFTEECFLLIKDQLRSFFKEHVEDDISESPK